VKENDFGLVAEWVGANSPVIFGRIAQTLGATEINDDVWDELEGLLIQADVGVETTLKLVENMQARVRREGITRQTQLQNALKKELIALLGDPPPMNISGRELSVIFIVGVNGSGKTTSIGKLAYRLKNAGRNPVIAAGDTFRAAAIEQLQLWGERAGVPVIAGTPNADPGAVVFDAARAAVSRGHDILIVDTAGRLHTKFNLMEELAKIRGVIRKVVPDAPHETLLVLDGTTGQNARIQARHFQESVAVTGTIVTKLDSTAKGGMIFAIHEELKLPIHYIGVGEAIHDLLFFDPEQFVDGLFENNDH
jgi:fused signal recognition particle receptor